MTAPILTNRGNCTSAEFKSGSEGTFFDLPEAIYRDAEGINISLLKRARTPAHFLAAKTAPPEEPTPAQVLGTLTHRAILEPDRPCLHVIKPDGMDFRSKEGKAWRDSQVVPIVTKEEGDAIAGMLSSVWAHPIASVILKDAQKEVSVFKQDSVTELLLKGRLDALTMDNAGMTTIADLKTAEDASLETFTREVLKWGLHRQAAWYLDLTGATFFVLIVVEKAAPFAVSVFNVDTAGIEIGRRANRADLNLISECIKSGEWPAYPQEIQQISLPEWALRKESRPN